MTRHSFDLLLLCLGTLVLIAAFIASSISTAFFLEHFGNEDSFIENVTAPGLAIAGLVLIVRAIGARHEVARGAVALGLLYGLAYIWAGGEEISWGQRIIGFESPEYFAENNDQQEFTFHNLVVAGVKLDEVIFGPLLSAIILTYLVILPVLWAKVGWVQRLSDAMLIPVPRLHHAAFALAVTLIIPFLDQTRRWEVYECIFAFLSLAIFLYPANPLSFERGAQRDLKTA